MITVWPNENYSQNPWLLTLFSTLRAMELEVSGFRGISTVLSRPRLLIINWIESPLNKGSSHYIIALYRIFLLYLFKALKIKIIWVVHNIGPHDRKIGNFGKWYLRNVAAISNGIIALNEETTDLLSEAICFPKDDLDCKCHFLPHGPYHVSIGNEDDHEIIYDFGFFGSVRPYKRVFPLIDEKRLLDVGNVIVVGEMVDGQQSKLKDKLCLEYGDKLQVVDRFTGNEEFVNLIRKCRTVVLPYTGNELNTGIGNLCASLGVPIIGADTPSLRQLIRDWGDSMVTTFDRHIEASVPARRSWKETFDIATKLELTRRHGWKNIIDEYYY
ncbi:glycosyltransferase [Pelagibacterium lacus]|uniref:glycosyltransferase n=1 Tax=Pelagibacterium lacus TaxID=2282655 RepID=UPI0011C02842|nr:glycosyltransferase [Pelagibacterium lacus]